jgi:alkylhydroperoxidase family enzyme
VSDALTGRLAPVDPASAPTEMQEIFARQTELWGSPLAPTLVMAHCPPLARAAGGLAVALEKSGQVPAELRDLICLRVAQIIGCPF